MKKEDIELGGGDKLRKCTWEPLGVNSSQGSNTLNDILKEYKNMMLKISDNLEGGMK